MPVIRNSLRRPFVRLAPGRTVLYRKETGIRHRTGGGCRVHAKAGGRTDNRLADEALAEDSEGVPIEILFQRYGIERE